LVQQIRSIEREQGSPRVPALALTAFARPEDRERAVAAGFDVHLAKPVDPDRLMEQIARLAGRRPT
jgi:CheY-like chemotaxis protein